MTTSKNKRMQINQRRESVARAYLGGSTIRHIAAELHCSPATICNDLRALNLEWQQHAQQAISKQKMLQLARYDHIQSQAWQAFEKSQGEIIIRTRRGRGAVSADPGVAPGANHQEVRRFSPGDPRYLQIVIDAVTQQCRLYGLLPAVKLSEPQPVSRIEIVERRWPPDENADASKVRE